MLRHWSNKPRRTTSKLQLWTFAPIKAARKVLRLEPLLRAIARIETTPRCNLSVSYSQHQSAPREVHRHHRTIHAVPICQLLNTSSARVVGDQIVDFGGGEKRQPSKREHVGP